MNLDAPGRTLADDISTALWDEQHKREKLKSEKMVTWYLACRKSELPLAVPDICYERTWAESQKCLLT